MVFVAPLQVPKINPHPDFPAVADTEDGGPLTSPGLLEPAHKFTFESVQGFFVQTGPLPKHHDFEDLLDKSFGLMDTSADRWHNLRADVARLQAEAPAGVHYKVFFLGRHGQGWHNYGAEHYGVESWENYWTCQNGDGNLVWGPDPELTPLGHKQTRAIYETWQKERPHGAPINPGEIRWFVSPLQRTCQTMYNSWGEMISATPEIWESTIAARFPDIIIEEGFEENDLLWFPDQRESDTSMQKRMRRALDRVFDGAAPETYVSITGHGAIFRNLLAVLGHQPYPLSTGEMIPVVVKATRVNHSHSHSNGHRHVNGHTNHVNGLKNGHANGHVNGHAHHHSNGHTNGHANGNGVPAAKH